MAGVRGAVVLVIMLLLAGCTTVAGQPGPADPTASAPTRPREVRIDGVDPCSLLTEEQRVELGLDGRPRFDDSPLCSYPGDVPMCVFGGLQASSGRP